MMEIIEENDQYSSDEEMNIPDESMDRGVDKDSEDESSDGYIESDSDSGSVIDGDGVVDSVEKDNSELNEDERDDGRKNQDESEEVEKKKKKKAPYKQKPIIHTLLKRAKIYEIRKLTRRSNMLRSAKGTEEQQTKKQRKADRLRKEIEAIREFMIDELTERTASALRGKNENELYNEMWEACADPIKVNDMIQILSNKAEENFSDIAYFRMLSSKDVVEKLKRIASGENMSTTKPRKKKKGKNNKDLKQPKKPGVKSGEDKQKPISLGDNQASDENSDIEMKSKLDVNKENETEKIEKRSFEKKNITKSKKKENTVRVDKNKTEKIEEETNPGKEISKQKAKRTKKDDFFMDHSVEVSDDENSTGAEEDEEEFTAPVINRTDNPDIVPKKKNRMGQRDRKRLQDIKHGRNDPRQRNSFRGRGSDGGRGRGGRTSRGRGSSYNNRENGIRGRGSSFSKPRVAEKKKEVDESLHPSWQAKQRQKNQQSISGFSGTKITFDD